MHRDLVTSDYIAVRHEVETVYVIWLAFQLTTENTIYAWRAHPRGSNKEFKVERRI